MQVVEGCDAALQLDADKADILALVQARPAAARMTTTKRVSSCLIAAHLD